MNDKPEETKLGWLARLKNGLNKTSTQLGGGISALLKNRKLDASLIEDIEDLLIMSDLGADNATKLARELANERFAPENQDIAVREFIAERLAEKLKPCAIPLPEMGDKKPLVILFSGVNGSGKTTTIGKLAAQYSKSGKKVLLAACDTFRAAAVEQLKVWGERSGCEVIARETGADPSGLAFDALQKAINENYDILMVDTAGRLQNKSGLMEELKKIVRVLQKIDETAPHISLLVLDATIGQNAHSQVAAFKDMINISGLVVTKLDGTAKGGVLVALAEKFALPVHFIGVGESISDLQPFSARDYASGIMGL